MMFYEFWPSGTHKWYSASKWYFSTGWETHGSGSTSPLERGWQEARAHHREALEHHRGNNTVHEEKVMISRQCAWRKMIINKYDVPKKEKIFSSHRPWTCCTKRTGRWWRTWRWSSSKAKWSLLYRWPFLLTSILTLIVILIYLTGSPKNGKVSEKKSRLGLAKQDNPSVS